MVKPTNKTVAELLAQQQHLQQAVVKYKHTPKLVRAEQITEQQITSKGGKPYSGGSDGVANKTNSRQAALKRSMKRGSKA